MKLSIIIQGVVYDFTPRCVNSIRSIFPKAQIIFSTWDGQDTSAINADTILKLNDPGLCTVCGGENTKRQLYGVQKALSLVSENIVLKARSDAMFTSSECLEHLFKWGDCLNAAFNHRIVVPNMQTVDPQNESQDKTWHRVFNVSDWAMLGSTDDICKLFDIDLAGTSSTRYSPEQYLWMPSVRRAYPEIDVKDMNDRTARLIQQCLNFYAESLVILDTTKQFAFRSQKYIGQADEQVPFLAHNKWLRLRR